MSEEIRTLMNKIVGLSDLLLDCELPSEAKQCARLLRRTTDQVLPLLNELMEDPLAVHEFSLREVTDCAADLALARNIRVSVRLAPDLPAAVAGDSSLLKQALHSLLQNAGEEKVFLTVRAREFDGASWLVEFLVDCGNASTCSVLAQGLVERMGGRLTRWGGAWRLEVTLAAGTANEERGAMAMQELHGRRALIIDEDPTARLILRSALNAWGLTCSTFSSAREGLAGMAGGSDYALAIVGGKDPLAEIRNLAPELPVVMVSSGSRRPAAQAGIVAHVRTLLTRAELLVAVARAMQGPEEAAPPLLEGEPARGLDILMTENSPEGRLLIRAHLRGTPHRLYFASSEADAVNQLGRGGYGLALFDMDPGSGNRLAAIRRIRQAEQKNGLSAVPILGLMGPSGPRGLEESIASGCDACLEKPVSKVQLRARIAELTTPRKIRLTKIAVPEGLEEIVPGYFAARKMEVPHMLGLLAASDFERLRVLGHNMKGTGESYGFPELTRYGAEVERLAKESDGGALQGQLTELRDYLDRLEI